MKEENNEVTIKIIIFYIKSFKAEGGKQTSTSEKTIKMITGTKSIS